MTSPQIPISDALCGTGRLYLERNFHASKRNSIRLLINANNGANLCRIINRSKKDFRETYGKATTNKVTKPN